MDNQNEITDKSKESSTTFRIRFTIANNNFDFRECSSRNSEINCENLCNTNHYDKSSTNDLEENIHNHIIEIETNKLTTIEQKNNSKKKLFELIEPQNHKSSLIVNLTDGNCSTDNQNNCESHLFISPDLNQSSPPSPTESYFLSATNSSENININNTLISGVKNETKLCFDSKTSAVETSTEFADADKDNNSNYMMSNSCNFIHSWMSANRRRSSSVTRPLSNANNKTSDNLNSTTNDTVNGRRASSSNNLDVPSNPMLHSSSGNNLGVSTETICGNDFTQTNKKPIPTRPASANDNNDHNKNKQQQHSVMMQPIEISISTDDEFGCEVLDQQDYYVDDNQPISLNDILAIDMEGLRLQDECKNLEDQVEFMEQKVEELERQRFADDVSRTLVESVLKQRRRLRELEFQIYKLSLDSEVSDRLSHEGALVSPLIDDDDTSFTHNNKYFLDCKTPMYPGDLNRQHDGNNRASGRFGSKIKPGQENTADILDAIPPSGSLQHKQYLNRASTGTDTREYSRLPLFSDFHRHQLPSLHNNQQPIIYSSDESNNVQIFDHHHPSQHHHRKERHHHHHHHNHHHNSPRNHQQREQPVYVQLVDHKVRSSSSENRNHHHYQRPSPVRPDHFKGEFKMNNNMNISQDSSSTASSSSPHS